MSVERNDQKTVDEARRDFLRKSVYAAYATPVITALLVSKVSAASSANAIAACNSNGGKWIPSQECCDTNRDGDCGN